MMFLFLALYAVQLFPRSMATFVDAMKEPFVAHVKGFARGILRRFEESAPGGIKTPRFYAPDVLSGLQTAFDPHAIPLEIQALGNEWEET
jgi:hypothetical protein